MLRYPKLWPNPVPIDRDRPTLLLLHGFTGSASVWEESIASLHTSFNCIAVDLPGHGGHAVPCNAGAFSFEGTCDLIIELFDDLDLARAHVWGYSMGGRLALYLALDHPHRIDRLVLESVSPGIADDNERKQRLESDELLAQRIEQGGVPAFVDLWLAQPLFASQKLLSPERQRIGQRLRCQNTATGLAAALRGFGSGAQRPMINRLAELVMPTMLLTGELDEKYSAIAKSMATSIPGAQLLIMPNVGHAPHWENPSRATDAVREFLTQKSGASK